MVSIEKNNRSKLPSKYVNLLAFGYWFLNNLDIKDKQKIQTTYLSLFHCNGNIEQQIHIFDEFWSDRKHITKVMKDKKQIGRPKKIRNQEIDTNSLLGMLIEESLKDIQGPPPLK